MHRRMRVLAPWPLFALLAAAPVVQGAPPVVTAREAAQYVGQQATVCGAVASAKYAANTPSQATFLNLDAPFPRHLFTAVIWGADRPKFASPPEERLGRHICVSGLVELYKNRPEIIVTDPSQMTE